MLTPKFQTRAPLPSVPAPRPPDPGRQDPSQHPSTIPVRYSVHLTLEGHAAPVILEMACDEQARLMGLLQDPRGYAFVVVDCLHEMVALRVDSVAMANFLFDPMGLPTPPLAEEGTFEIQVYLDGRPDPVPISVSPDEPRGLEDGCVKFLL